MSKELPASPEARAKALAEARKAIAEARPPRAKEPPQAEQPQRPAPRNFPPAEALQNLHAAVREARAALSRLEAALLDYENQKEGTSHE